MSERSTRRQFTKSVALLAAAPLAAGAESSAAQPGNPPDSPIAPSAQALHDFIRARFGKFLNEEQLKRVRQRLELGLRSADLLKKFPLENSDEPDFTFSADTQG